MTQTPPPPTEVRPEVSDTPPAPPALPGPSAPPVFQTPDKQFSQALFAAQKAIQAVSKDGHNKHGGYDYASAENMIVHCRQALHDNGLTVRRGSWSISEARPPVVSMKFQCIHAVSGQGVEDTIAWPAIEHKGMPIDKAVAAALTSAYSYWLRDLLMVPRTDIEMDQRDDSNYRPQPQSQNRPPARTGNTQGNQQGPGGGNNSAGAPMGNSGDLFGIEHIEIKKQGESDKGPWTIWAITLAGGVKVETFDDTLTGQARKAMEGNYLVVVAWSQGQYGNKLESVEIPADQQPQQSPPATTTDNGNTSASPAASETETFIEQITIHELSDRNAKIDGVPRKVFSVVTADAKRFGCINASAVKVLIQAKLDNAPVSITWTRDKRGSLIVAAQPVQTSNGGTGIPGIDEDDMPF